MLSFWKMAARGIVGLLLSVNFVLGGSYRGLSPNSKADVDDAFHIYMKDYGKHYASKDEHAMRQAIFLKNWKIIEHHNSQNHSYTMKVNQFADRTDEEVAGGGALPAFPKEAKPFPFSKEEIKNLMQFLPKDFDMRRMGYISSVKSQGRCGSCWAFAIAGAVEGALARKRGGPPVDLSEQALVDCVGLINSRTGGCLGNSPIDTFDYIKEKGLPAEKDYPYKAKTGTCHDENMTKYRIVDYTFPTSEDPDAMKVALYLYGPVVVQVNFNDKFRKYDEGIFYDPECNYGRMTHQMLVVGYGNRDGEDYWVLKNSHGPFWGMGGYGLISARDNNCFVLTILMAPIVSSE